MPTNAPPVSNHFNVPGRSPAGDATRVRLALNAALDAWWEHGRLPPPALLRDGLFLLQAGHTLEEAQASLLLRAALAEHKGMVTALRHQSDPERTAVILADSLLALPPAALTLAELQRLRREDESSDGWMASLPAALYEETSSADARRRRRALDLIDALGAGLPSAAVPDAYAPVEESDWIIAEGTPAGRRGAGYVRAALLFALLLVLLLAGLWLMERLRLEGMVRVPAGVYPVSAAAAGGEEPVTVPAFAIDRTEVTIGAYRACLARGRCPQPSATAGETRPNYLLDSAFERFPMVNVDWDTANAYCTFAGKRLPSAAEWEIAAGYAPGFLSLNRYPWGEQFQLQRANSARTGLGDTQEVGSYRPSGDSAAGAADMAGNVAEWTATNVGRAEGGSADRFLVKGGSYRDPPAAQAVGANAPVEATFWAPWLGFRCAVAIGGG